MLGYKVVRSIITHKLIIAELEIPTDAYTNIDRQVYNKQYAKYRASHVIPVCFYDINLNKIDNYEVAQSCYLENQQYYISPVQYAIHETVFANNYTMNADVVCGEGIHFFTTILAAQSYVFFYKNDCPKINITNELALKYSLVNPFELDTTYKLYDEDGQYIALITYKNRLIHQFETILPTNVWPVLKTTFRYEQHSTNANRCDQVKLLIKTIYSKKGCWQTTYTNETVLNYANTGHTISAIIINSSSHSTT